MALILVVYPTIYAHSEALLLLLMITLRVFYFFFFFSSRRRHTRSLCDWSSDVCSSDRAGVKDPAKAYEKMMARKDLAAGKKGGLAHVAQLKLDDHKRKHPELHLAEATGKRTRGAHGDAKTPRRRSGGTPADFSPSHKGHRAGGTPADYSPSSKRGKRSPHEAHAGHADHLPGKPRGGNKPKTKLEQALARGKGLIKKGERVANQVHAGLGKVQGVVEKGLAGAQKVQAGLERASDLAKAGAGILGDDSELGKYLLEMSAKADQVHGYLEQGIGLADEFNKGVGKAHDLTGKIPGVHDDGEEAHAHGGGGKKPRRAGGGGHDGTPLQHATHLGVAGKHKAGGGGHDGTPVHHGKAGGGGHDGTPVHHKPSPHDTKPHGGKTPGVPAPAHAGETEDQKTKRLQHAWDKIGYVSGAVQRFETNHAKVQRKIQEMLAKGQGNAASIELMGLGSECDEISKAIKEAKTLAKGHDKYEKEIAFYEDWHKKTKAKLHAAIADTKGLGGQVAVSGFGISEKSHPDIFENTKNIYAVRTKVQAFGEALHDADAAPHVKKLLAEAKAAKADLGKLKSKYKKDKAAYDFLTGGGTQDKLIDDCLKKLEGPAKGEAPKDKKPSAIGKKDPGQRTEKKKPGEAMKSVEGGLKAIEKYRKKAVKAGKKVDATLGHVEKALGKGIKAGKKIDSGLEKLAGMADQVSHALGEDTELGHFAHQVGQ